MRQTFKESLARDETADSVSVLRAGRRLRPDTLAHAMFQVSLFPSIMNCADFVWIFGSVQTRLLESIPQLTVIVCVCLFVMLHTTTLILYTKFGDRYVSMCCVLLSLMHSYSCSIWFVFSWPVVVSGGLSRGIWNHSPFERHSAASYTNTKT